MTQQKDNRILKVLLVLFVIGFVGLGVWSYQTFQENEGIKVALTVEKDEIQKELQNIEKEYTIEIDKGNALSADLVSAKNRITRLIDSVSRLKGDVKVIAVLRRELANIKKERDVLQDKISTLEIVNQMLTMANDSTRAALNNQVLKTQDQSAIIENLNSNVARAAALVPTNFKPVGVIIRSSGKQIENDRARRVDDIKVCFTLPENPLANTGVVSYLLQVIDPENNVIGENKTKDFDGQQLSYSKVIQFNYKGKELDLCELVGLNEDNIVKGRYRINLYNGAARVSSGEITLR
jgi:hypothetical protein